jgi:hypothetical protein
MNDVFPHIKKILDNYKGKTININKIKKADSIDIIKEQNIYIKEYIIRYKINAGYSMCIYKYIYFFYNIRGNIGIYDIKNKCYYYYNRDKDIDNNIIKMTFIFKFIWKNKKNELRFYTSSYKDKISIYNIDKYKLIYNNKLIYIFGLSL